MLPIVLLGIRAAWKEDLSATSADLVYGEPIRLPGEFLAVSPRSGLPPSNLALRLRNYFADLAPQPIVRHGQRKPFIFKGLSTCSHICIRRDAHRVISKHEKYFIVNVKGENTTVSIDRLKPVHLLPDDKLNESEQHNDDDNNTTLTTSTSPESSEPRTSRFSSPSYRPSESDSNLSTPSPKRRVRFR
ncbi:PREDICTED: uncharacterized protein LOC108977346 [Bactrocera latifrons]|uniref:uncharacterized protein LOC108977346 n=1 Tax=Bactrocera latifrons TaxID=174628 RepID=UPI0008DC66FF|nr:PREDICTED: uncharacterized protein LOC108977346 [Bactrocera latifrons]